MHYIFIEEHSTFHGVKCRSMKRNLDPWTNVNNIHPKIFRIYHTLTVCSYSITNKTNKTNLQRIARIKQLQTSRSTEPVNQIGRADSSQSSGRLVLDWVVHFVPSCGVDPTQLFAVLGIFSINYNLIYLI